ncbi:NAD(P)-dependent oxidoreductase [Gracilibacillus boraciitolerans]|uniref:NAD(P)-dependent oxidoreductase n=1 Tax=Gracilibacillus boraciitolerans TaxID=307521 RepID=UPI001F2B5ED8|nr:NAD(P)-dependent oxidoreductase [Gracilibacillus boraciitolerans]
MHDNKWPEDVILTRMICSFGERISEYCLSYILKDLQSHDQFQALQSHKEWQSITPKMLSESKILIYGTGEIGQKIAQAISFFGGVNVYGVSLSGKQKDFFKKVFSLDDHYPLLEEMDFIINTLPLTSDTENMLNKDIFSYLSDAVLINVGRGGKSLSEGDLIHAIKNGKIRLAVLDVLAEEPLPKYHELWNHPQVIITPHISAVTTAEEAVESFVDTLSRIEKNQPLYNRVDIEKGY